MLRLVKRVVEIHCETCGAAVAIDADNPRYCLDCDLYLCLSCWNSYADSCRLCSPLGTLSQRRPRAMGVRTARRADRRLREATKQATVLAATVGRDVENLAI